MQFTAKELTTIFENSAFEGDLNATISSIASLEAATENDLSFLGNKKYSHLVPETKAKILLLPNSYKGKLPENASIFRAENPSAELSKLCAILEKQLRPAPKAGFVHPTAVISQTAKIDPTAHIGALCIVEDGAVIGKNTVLQAHNYIGRNASLGEDCFLMPNAVVMDRCVLKDRVRLQPGVVIGSDGYGYEFVNGQHTKVPQIGIVCVQDDVEIGANTCIDRARFDKTLIGQGTKIDNLVQIAHNVQTGQGCLFVSQVGISGSTKLGNYVVLGGQVGVAGHLNIGDGVMLGGQSGVNGDIPAGSYMRGTPPMPYVKAHKIDILKTKLPEILDRLRDVEKHLGISKKTF